MQVDALELVKAGQIIYIEDSTGSSWPFGINNILNREFIVCQALGRKSTPLRVDSTNRLTVVLPQEHGAYMIRSEIIESDDLKSKITLRPTMDIDFIQRRQYFRVLKPSTLAHYQLLDSQTQDNESMPIEGLVWDLSGNGIGIIIRATKAVYTGTEIKVILTLPGREQIELVGGITRVVPKSIIKNEYLLGIYFKKIRESDRDKIIKFVIQEQVAHKGLKKR
jgi:c-di-GMP-binding flagellar brake protein YcgR